MGAVPEKDPAAELWAEADLVTPMALRVVATLGVADQIAGGARTAAELAEAVDVDADALDRVLRHLVCVGVLEADPSGYALTRHGEALRDDHPSGLRRALDAEASVGRADLAFVELLHTVRTGEPAFPARFGRPFWDDIAADPERTAAFDAKMASDVGADAPDIVSAYDWRSLGHVVDVGGGDGKLLIAMLRAYPDLRGTVLERCGTAEAARRALTEAGLADRADVVAGSFFDPLPKGAGGYVLSAILHDWDDDSARAILRRCAEASGPQGAVFVVEKIGADGRSIRTDMDLRMLVYTAGRERTADELGVLADDCGLRVAAIHPAGASAVVELAPAAG